VKASVSQEGGETRKACGTRMTTWSRRGVGFGGAMMVSPKRRKGQGSGLVVSMWAVRKRQGNTAVWMSGKAGANGNPSDVSSCVGRFECSRRRGLECLDAIRRRAGAGLGVLIDHAITCEEQLTYILHSDS